MEVEAPDARSTSVNVPPISSASFLATQAKENPTFDCPRIIVDRKGSGE